MSIKPQKFKHGDFVRVAKDLGQFMSHFTSDVDAIVMYSYNDKFGGGNTTSYCIYIKDGGEVSWYYEDQLTLIESGCIGMLKEWKDEAEQRRVKQSDLDWIFANGESILKEASGASIAALAECFGLNNLWGRNGEGVTYYANAMATLRFAAPFLIAGDKSGYLEKCKEVRA